MSSFDGTKKSSVKPILFQYSDGNWKSKRSKYAIKKLVIITVMSASTTKYVFLFLNCPLYIAYSLVKNQKEVI